MCSTLSFTFTFGQQNKEVYKFSSDILSEIEKDTVAWKYQTGAANLSFIGDYANTLSIWDKAVPSRKYIPTLKDSAVLSQSTTLHAREYILEKSKNEQIIIINEAHHHPRHRAFTRSLLKGLYMQGYRYLGLEALFDTLINIRNYPIQESGYYTKEPEFGNLLYEARRIGFTVFGYEASEGKNGKEREMEQAKNIQKYMSTHTEGKYLIHCGFDHVFENEVRNWEKAMAGRLKEYTGIDPFTIDQVRFSERSKAENSHYFLYATKNKEPFILKLNQNEVFNGLTDPKQTDVVIIHPISKYKNARPEWIMKDKQEYLIAKSALNKYKYPIQIMAYRINEYENGGIPADIIELDNKQSAKSLYLQSGKYTLILRNQKYEVVDKYTISIK